MLGVALILSAAIAVGLVLVWPALIVLRDLRGPAMTGTEGLSTREGLVEEWSGEEGWVLVDGERWRARSENALAAGDRVDVIGAEGLTLEVTWARRRLLGR